MKKFKNLNVSTNEEGLVRIILNDPKTYNSLSLETINSLKLVLKLTNNDNKSKVIIIEGEGKGFSAGHNLKKHLFLPQHL